MKIKVQYWRGTTQLEGTATTYEEAIRIASQNQNASPPRFYDEDGVALHDDGSGLAYHDPEVRPLPNGATEEVRQYAV